MCSREIRKPTPWSIIRSLRVLIRSARWRGAVCSASIILFFASPACEGAHVAPECDSKTVFQHADTLLKQRQYDQAEKLLRGLSTCRNLSSVDRFNIGWFYGRAHHFKEALGIFYSLGPDVPDRQTHEYAIALTQFELADYRGTVGTLTKLKAQQSLTAESVNLLAVAYSKLALYQEAYTVLREEILKDRNDRLAYLNLVTLLCDAAKFSEAAYVAGQLVAVFPQDSDALVVRGAAYTLLGEMDKARSDFEAAIRISPLEAAPRFFLAVSDFKRGNYTAVVEELSEAIHSGVDDSDLHYLLAEALLRVDPDNTQKIAKELDRAIALNRRSVSALSLRGKLLMEQHHLKAAVADLELAHSIDPDSHSATYNLARAYFASGRREEADALNRKLAKQTADAVGELTDRKLKSTLSGEPSR